MIRARTYGLATGPLIAPGALRLDWFGSPNGNDDSATFNAAMAALPASGGQIIVPPSTTWRLSNWSPNANVEIIGHGYSSVITTTTADSVLGNGSTLTTGLITPKNANIVISNLRFQGYEWSSTSETLSYPLVLLWANPNAQVAGLRVNNCWFRGGWQAVNLSNTTDFYVSDISIDQTMDRGFLVSDGCARGLVNRLKVQNSNLEEGIVCGANAGKIVEDIIFDDLYVYGCGIQFTQEAMDLYSPGTLRRISIRNFDFRGNGHGGFEFKTSALGLNTEFNEDIDVGPGYISCDASSTGIRLGISNAGGNPASSKAHRFCIHDVHIHSTESSTSNTSIGIEIAGYTDVAVNGVTIDGNFGQLISLDAANTSDGYNHGIIFNNCTFRDGTQIRVTNNLDNIVFNNCNTYNVTDLIAPAGSNTISGLHILGGRWLCSGIPFQFNGTMTITDLLVKNAVLHSSGSNIVFSNNSASITGTIEGCDLICDGSVHALDLRSSSGTLNVWSNDLSIPSGKRTWVTTGGTITVNSHNNRRGIATGAPTTAGAVGDRYVNVPPTSAQPIGWTCTTAGDSGSATWKAEPSLA